MNYDCVNILKWTEAQLKYTYDVSLQEATAQELLTFLAGAEVTGQIAERLTTLKKTIE